RVPLVSCNVISQSSFILVACSPLCESSTICSQRSEHSSQMKTVGPAISLNTSYCDLPQKLQYRVFDCDAETSEAGCDAETSEAGRNAESSEAGCDAETSEAGCDAETSEAGCDAETSEAGCDAETSEAGCDAETSEAGCDGMELEAGFTNNPS